MITHLAGGIGLFLLGMMLMTDGLKNFAGDSLRRALIRLTGKPLRSFFTGTVITSMVQSSTATMMTTIGFVSAGLMTFPQAIGVLFGAALGTTSTGWLVSLLGLKFSIGTITLPFIGIGALIKLFVKGRFSALGLAISGFGLIFVGIDFLQEGMADLSKSIAPEDFPPVTLLGRIFLFFIGLAMTVIMQSSSAAVATTLAAYSAETLSWGQAASLIIGQNVGTAVTTGIASIGGSISAKRTALAFVCFSIVAAFLGFIFLPIFQILLQAEQPSNYTLAMFHTLFNVMAILLLLPLINTFSRTIIAILPEKETILRNLDPSLRNIPPVALETIKRTTAGLADQVLAALKHSLEIKKERIEQTEKSFSTSASGRPEFDSIRLDKDSPNEEWKSLKKTLSETKEALVQVREFLGSIPGTDENPETVIAVRLSVLHSIDHLTRLISICKRYKGIQKGVDSRYLLQGIDYLIEQIDLSKLWLRGEVDQPDLAMIEQLSHDIANSRKTSRHEILTHSARLKIDPEVTMILLDAMRWIDGLAYQIWRLMHHISSTSKVPDYNLISDPESEAENADSEDLDVEDLEAEEVLFESAASGKENRPASD